MVSSKPDAFVMMVALMSEKLVSQEQTISDLTIHIHKDHGVMDDMQRTITDLRTQLDARYDELDRIRTEANRLADRAADATYYQNRVRALEEENAQLRLKADPGVNQRVEDYMKREGAALWRKGEKIACIKGVRAATREVLGDLHGWDLRQTKDFCEGYDYSVHAEEEERGPRTMRSSGQVKVG